MSFFDFFFGGNKSPCFLCQKKVKPENLTPIFYEYHEDGDENIASVDVCKHCLDAIASDIEKDARGDIYEKEDDQD